MSKIALIKLRIQEAMSPSYLEVIDESDQHRGHAGHQGGGRHFSVVVSADCLVGLSRVTQHRKIYDLFSDLIPDEIHALKIRVV